MTAAAARTSTQGALDPLIAGLAVACGIGFLAPKIPLGGLNVGVAELCATMITALMLIHPAAVRFEGVKNNRPELVYAAVLLLYGMGHGIFRADVASTAVALRTAVFVTAGTVVAGLPTHLLRRALVITTAALLLYYLVPTVTTIVNLATGRLSLFSLLWDYGSGRLTAPHETGTSSVPLGYMFSILLVFACVYEGFGRWRKPVTGMLLVACMLTASRAATLSAMGTMGLVVLGKAAAGGRVRDWLPSLIVVVVVVVVGGATIISKSIIDGALDASGSQRLTYYSAAIANAIADPSGLLWGYGVSEVLLHRITGISFYESLFFNSLAQGGLPLALASVPLMLQLGLRLIEPADLRTRRGIASLWIVVAVGNVIGGSNYFSQFAFMSFFLLKEFVLRRQK